MASARMRRPLGICGALALMSGALAAFYGYRLDDAARFNAALGDRDYARAGAHASARGELARAFALHRAGDYDQAVKHYAQAEEAAGDGLRPAIQYNLATLYLERAMGPDAGAADVSLPLIELAKESYRRLLRADSGDWDAKYNLELAIRLSAEPEDEEVEQTVTPERTPRAPRAPLGYGGLP